MLVQLDQPMPEATGQQPATSGKSRRPRKRRRLIACLVLLVSTVFALAMGEFVARWYIEGSFLEAVDSVLGLRTAADPRATPPFVQDQELGFTLNPACKDVNSLCIRGEETLVDRPKSKFRVLVIGDSISWPLDGYVALFQQERGDLDIINASVPGYTTYQERLLLERNLMQLDPDLVLLQYCLNDNYRFLHRVTSKGRWLMTFEARAKLLPEGGGFLARLSRSSYLVYAVRRALYTASLNQSGVPWKTPIIDRAWNEACWPEEEQQIRAIADSLARAGIRFAVIAVPHENQLSADVLKRHPAKCVYPQTKLAAICRREHIPILDLHPAFVAAGETGLFKDRLHLSAKGHALALAQLTAFLSEHALVPAPPSDQRTGRSKHAK